MFNNGSSAWYILQFDMFRYFSSNGATHARIADLKSEEMMGK